ncbi:YhgE/Pip domain-containing protein [Parvibacter caecicola]|uniref:YhgE/Pip domain-containing protein n=1 Tax=Parvibacter caecicola TaxID=747645 RepID=A0A4T9TB42_9ACTN|nr:YhgE/Pip domain-containing protein [Parvibacter caecicola]TJW10728.1 YhgE/Pip domain-containing protein [Parvibacter caecicola]
MKLRENIHNVFAVFARDMKRLLRNPIALVIVLGVCIMPSLYAWYTIEAQWDPYQNTEAIKVGVVNLDEGADSAEAGHLAIGEEVVAQLKDDHQLGWQFVDEQEGIQRVESGEYYACIVIPKNFSADFASIATGTFTKPELEYYVNEKLSGAAPKITDAGATALESKVNHSFISTVTDVVMGTMQKVGASVQQKATGAETGLSRDLEETRDSIATTNETIEGLKPTLDKGEEAVRAAQEAFSTVEGELPAVTKDLDDAQAQIATIREDLARYSSEASERLSTGLAALRQVSLGTAAAVAQATTQLQQAKGGVDGALAQAKGLAQTNDQLISALAPYGEANADVASMISSLKTANENLSATVDKLSALSDGLADAVSAGGAAATAADDAVAQASGQLQAAVEKLQGTVVPQLEGSLGQFSEALGTLRGVTVALSPALDQAKITLGQMGDTLAQARSATVSAGDSLTQAQGQLEQSLTDMKSLSSSQSVKELEEFLGADDSSVGDFLASPVALKTIPVFPVANYGSGVAPFFTNLALWVAGFILMAMVRLRVDPTGLPPLTITQAYFGRWLTFMVLALLQGLICCCGDLALGIQCDQPALFVLAGVLTVLVDVNLMYALAYAMKHVGKAIAVILLIMQIPGSSGMFPVEMMPSFFQAIHPWLPFTYSIDAMRQAIGGLYGSAYVTDLLILLLFVPLGLFIGLVLGRYAFNLNILFDGKLAATNLYVCEQAEGASERPRFRMRAMMQALLDMPSYRTALKQRAAAFRRAYPWLKRAAWVLIFLQPLVTFAIMVLLRANIETKVVLMVAMVCGIIAVDVYLIVVDYLDESLRNREKVAGLSGDALVSAVREAVPAAVGGTGALGATVEAAAGTGAAAPAAKAPDAPAAGGQSTPPDGGEGGER